METWRGLWQSGDSLAAWDEFLERYRRLIFAAIRRSSTDPDDVMDVFAHVCEALRADDLARLRKYPDDGTARARFSTWLVTVVHHLAVDWLRHRYGREQAVAPAFLTLRQQAIYRLVFLEQHPHSAAFELVRQRAEPELSQREFGADLRAAQRAYNDSTHRALPKHVALSDEVPDSRADGEQLMHTVETRQHVEEAMAGLAAAERTALRLFVVEGMPAVDVARLVGWSDAKAVYNRVYRLLKTLRLELQERGIAAGDL